MAETTPASCTIAISVDGVRPGEERDYTEDLHGVDVVEPTQAQWRWDVARGEVWTTDGRFIGAAEYADELEQLYIRHCGHRQMETLVADQPAFATLTMTERADGLYDLLVTPDQPEVMLISIGADGTVGLLYPRPDVPGSTAATPAGGSLEIRDLVAEPPFGAETILAITAPAFDLEDIEFVYDLDRSVAFEDLSDWLEHHPQARDWRFSKLDMQTLY